MILSKILMYSYNYTLYSKVIRARRSFPWKGNKHGSVMSIVIRFLSSYALGVAVGQ